MHIEIDMIFLKHIWKKIGNDNRLILKGAVLKDFYFASRCRELIGSPIKLENLPRNLKLWKKGFSLS